MTTTKKTEKPDYQTLSLELDEVLSNLQQPDMQVDEAVVLYERGLALVQQLETYVTTAENKLESLRLQQGTDA